MSDEYDQEDPHTDVSNSKKKWNREMAEQWYANTKYEIENRLNGDYLIPVPEVMKMGDLIPDLIPDLNPVDAIALDTVQNLTI